MSRRRRRDDQTDGDILSEGESVGDNASNVIDSDIENDDLDVSEYESVDEEARHSSDEEPEQKLPEPGQQQSQEKKEVAPEENQEENGKQVQRSKEQIDSKTERESGDGKEQSDSEPHNDDVDSESGKKEEEKEEDDPAFIPTKGAFFQHDLRSDDQPKGRRDRKIWDKDPVKWNHDMFVMEEQMPKSRDMLISNYGYDIRDRPLDAHPPTDSRRMRGRGRGGYRGRGRGRPNIRRGQQRAEYNDENRDYKDEYPVLNNEWDSGMKVQSRSYYNKRNPRRDSAENVPSEKPRVKTETVQHKVDITRKAEENQPPLPKPSKSNETKEDEKLSDLLQVINNRESAPSSKETSSTTSSNSRRGDRYPKNYQNTTFSNYQEAPKPRRYSSLRQRQTNSPVDKYQPSQQYAPRLGRDHRYANFSKPVQPNQTVNFTKKSYDTNESTKPSQNKTSREEPKYVAPAPQTTVAQPELPQISTASMQQAHIANQQSVTFSAPNTVNMGGAPIDQTLMQMPQMPLQYNPMLTPMYEAALQQRMIRMMQQQMLQMNMNMDQIQLPSALPPPMDATSAGIPPDPQSLPHPGDMQMNSLVPPVSQTLSPGTLGSVMGPPPPPLNPPTYFNRPMTVNMGAPQQQPFPYPPNLVAQQVGGVTYFNTPAQSPPIQPGANQASPRRNAAIPIMAPNGFWTPGVIE